MVRHYLSLKFYFLSVILLLSSLIEIKAQATMDSLTGQIRSEIRERNYERGWKLYSELTHEYESINLPFDTIYGKASLYVAQSYIFSNKNEDAALHYKKAILIFEKDTFLPEIYKMQCYLGIGVAYKRMSQFQDAVKYYHKAKDLVISAYGPDDRGLHNIYNNLGNVYRILGDYDSAVENHEEAIRIRTLHYPPLDYHIGDSYNNLGLVYTDLKQYSKAIVHFKQALDHYQDQNVREQARAAKAGYNIARIYYNTANYGKCLEFLDPAIGLMAVSGGEQEFDFAEMLNTKTHVLIKIRQLDNASELLDQTILQKSKYLHEDHLNWTYTHNAAAEIANARGEFLTAESLYYRNLEILRIHYKGFHPEKVQAWQRLMQNAIDQHNLQKAGECLDSLRYLINMPNIEILNRNYHTLLLHEEAKYLYHQYIESHDVSALLESAKKAFESIFQIENNLNNIDDITQKLIAGNDRKYADLALDIISTAYEVIGEKIYLHHTLMIADHQKSTILKEMINRDPIINSMQFSEEENQRSFHLKNLLNQLRSEFYVDNNQLTVDKYDSIYTELSNLHQKVSHEGDSPFLSLDIQKLLKAIRKEDAILINYYWGTDYLYIHRIDRDGIDLTKLDIPDKHLLLEWREVILGLDSTTDGSRVIADKLLGSVLSGGDAGRKVIIIPDKELQMIPFEALKPAFLNGQFMINSFPLSYANSAGYWLKVRSLKSEGKKSIVAFAPEYAYDRSSDNEVDNNPDLVLRESNQRLKGAVSSVARIGEIFSGEIFIGKEASLEAFHQKASDHRIIHFSMHAYDDPEDPLSSALLFEPHDTLGNQMLTVRDIFNTDLSCDLAVLAACNTGWGQMNTSEGMQSLSYSFAYAGAKSTVMSLWRVPDESTSIIMQSFYTYLKDNYNKTEALRLAKLDYINNSVDAAQQHPYYWAGFVLNGDTSSLNMESNLNLFWVGGVLLLLGVFLRLSRRNYSG